MALRELRQSMLLVHTWTGVVMASVLIVVFWMGSLSVFDREIDRWMMPDTRIAAAPGPVSVERQVLPAVAALAHGKALAEWSVFLQGPRSPVARLQIEALDGEELSRQVDPRSATLLPAAGSYGATSFFFPMHDRLHLSCAGIGYWVVGLASMAMLALRCAAASCSFICAIRACDCLPMVATMASIWRVGSRSMPLTSASTAWALSARAPSYFCSAAR